MSSVVLLRYYVPLRNLETMTTALTRGGLIPEWTLGDRLRKAREAAGLEQQELAQRIGVARTTISNAEKGKVNPRRIVINAWSLATSVPVEWLETGQAPQPDGPNEGLEGRALPHLDSNQKPADSRFPGLSPANIVISMPNRSNRGKVAA